MKKLCFLGYMALTLSLYGEEAKVAYSSSTNQQPVQQADAGPYDDDDSDGESTSDETEDQDVIQMEEDDPNSEDSSDSE